MGVTTKAYALVTSPMNNNYFRIIDANLNRLREGLRVVEDIERYINNNKELSSKLKSLRHKVRVENFKDLLHSRDALNDVLKPSIDTELKRASLESIKIANLKRAQESSRVLEEMLKLDDVKISEIFKHIRYELYTIEKEILL